MMAFLKAESMIYKHMWAKLSLSVTNTLITAVEKWVWRKPVLAKRTFSTALFNVFVTLNDNKAYMYL